jgi:hypothetical protein
MSAEVRSWFGKAVPNVITHPTVRALVMKWMQIRSERMPVLADFWNSPDDKLLDSSILFIKGEGDYTYLHQGRHLQARIGFTMQGLNLSELRTRVRDELFEIYDRCAEDFEIGYLQSFADFQQDVMLWGRVCLPLQMSENDDRILVLLFCHAIDDKASVFRSLFENSRYPIAVAFPIYDDTRNLQDAWIIAQNEAASSLTGVFEHARDDLLLRSSPIFADEKLWAYLATGLADGYASATVVSKKNGSRHYLFAETVGEYIVLHLAQHSLLDATFEVG